MTNIRSWLWLGIAIGAVWAFRGVGGAAITAALGAVGFLIGTVIDQGGGIRSLFDSRNDSA